MYNHKNQYRCIIIRGKSKTDLDNLLPAYALVIDDVCPCKLEDFENAFNKHFVDLTRIADSTKKTLDNHRTEIAGKLFGMYYLSSDGYIYASERTKKFLSDNDQPAFFKDMCYKMQFPNGMNKIQTVLPYMEQHISLKQFPFIICSLLEAEKKSISLTAKDIGYYILNSLDVLQGIATPTEVIKQIAFDKNAGIKREIHVEGKAESFTMQHIKEQLNYLELANLIYVGQNKEIMLNHKEDACIKLFAENSNTRLDFDVAKYDLSTREGRISFYSDWDYYYSTLSSVSQYFDTSIDALIIPVEEDKPADKHSGDLIELGDAGEAYVFEYEKRRVAQFNPRLLKKIMSVGKTKGLGYDIQSVIAEAGDMAEYVKYIEVKSTKRVTAPNIDSDTWCDTFNITRNEWVAAQQHKEFYSIYRVYFVRDSVVMFILNDISAKEQSGTIQIVPMDYRVDFFKSAIDSIV